MQEKEQNTENKGAQENVDKTGWCLQWIYTGFLLAAIVVVVRIIFIQLTFDSHDDVISKYFKAKITKSTIEPVRGSILATDGQPLAISVPTYQVYMDCSVQKAAFAKMAEQGKKKYRKREDSPVQNEEEWIADARKLASGLAEIYKDRTAAEYFETIRNGRKKDLMYVKIGGTIDHETLKKVEDLPLFCEGKNRGGMIVEKKDSRQYPYGSLARRVIGYVKDNQMKGNIGIEGKYDHLLHGENGYEYLRPSDDRSTKLHDFDSSYVKAKDGCDIRTTLDINMQDIADQALRTQLGEDENLEGGCVIIMDVKTGAIRSMVNLIRDSQDNSLGENYNLAIGRLGEPGSVFKTVVLMSVLEDGYAKLSDMLPTNKGLVSGSGIRIPDDHIQALERKGVKEISVLHGFEISSNYVFIKLIYDNYKDNPKRYIDKLYSYKLGEAYDFDITGLATPHLPNPESKTWSISDLSTMGYGYSATETPLHVVTFYNAIANRGKMMKPYLIESISSNGKDKERFSPTILNGSICSKSVADSVAFALSKVVDEGTASTLKWAKCAVAGKTGTAKVALDNGAYQDKDGKRKYQATFVGFFPADEPKYTAIVVLYSKLSRNIYYGGTKPVRTFKEIVDKVYALDRENGERIN